MIGSMSLDVSLPMIGLVSTLVFLIPYVGAKAINLSCLVPLGLPLGILNELITYCWTHAAFLMPHVVRYKDCSSK